MSDAKPSQRLPVKYEEEFIPALSPALGRGTRKPSTLRLTDCQVYGQILPHRLSKTGKRSVRVNLKGIHKVNKHLANGERVDYYYAWRGGPRIKSTAGTEGFIQEYTEAWAARKKVPQGTVFTLISEFKDSAEFKTKISKKSRKAYESYLKLIEIEFGDMPLAALNDPEVRGEFKSWRDTMADSPRKADYAWTTLARVFSVAKDRGRIRVNPCERGGRLYEADRNDRLWSDVHIADMEKLAAPEIRLALQLALWTGQRQGDLLRLRWSDYDGKTIRLRQSKTGVAISVRVGAPLRLLLDGTPRRGPLILTNRRGIPWTEDGFRTSWAKACKKAKIQGLTFHDLRGSAITRLSLAGATAQEIAGVTGHSINDVATMLDRHYLGERVALGEKAIKRLERKERSKAR